MMDTTSARNPTTWATRRLARFRSIALAALFALESVCATTASGGVGHYDLTFAYRRVSTLYCGSSPSYDELRAFREAAVQPAVGRARLHARLDACLASDYWQKEALLRLADKRIRPQGALGADTTLRLGVLRLVLGDFSFDYRLWGFVMANDRDMRELLTADYHIVEAADGTLAQTRAVIPRPDRAAFAGGQPLSPEYRAGMITTQWFLHINTMLSALPRTTAAQAYRAYLGLDISRGEGFWSVPGEPTDIDQKGVAEPPCATCHATLDPLAYAFARYEGVPAFFPAGGPDDMRNPLDNIGGYDASRPLRRMPGWSDDRQQPYLLGKPVETLTEWAKVAVDSDEFKQNLAGIFFVHALGAPAKPVQHDDLAALWRGMREDRYSANRLLHRLVDSQSFGAPR